MVQDPKLLRPVGDGAPTCFLFVGNAGEAVGLPAERVARLCTIQGVVPTVDVPDPTKTFLYVTFKTASLASEARQELIDAENVRRKLTVKYADLHPKASRVSL